MSLRSLVFSLAKEAIDPSTLIRGMYMAIPTNTTIKASAIFHGWFWFNLLILYRTASMVLLCFSTCFPLPNTFDATKADGIMMSDKK